jgi:hypothetical protein
VFSKLVHRGEVVVAVRGEHVRLDDGARGDNPHQLAFDDALGLLGIFDLVADRDLVPGLDQLGDIAVGGVKRHPTHGNALTLGQGDIEHAACLLGILEKHFIEIAQAEHENGFAGDLVLDRPVLAHHWCRIGSAWGFGQGSTSGNHSNDFDPIAFVDPDFGKAISTHSLFVDLDHDDSWIQALFGEQVKDALASP